MKKKRLIYKRKNNYTNMENLKHIKLFETFVNKPSLLTDKDFITKVNEIVGDFIKEYGKSMRVRGSSERFYRILFGSFIKNFNNTEGKSLREGNFAYKPYWIRFIDLCKSKKLKREDVINYLEWVIDIENTYPYMLGNF